MTTDESTDQDQEISQDEANDDSDLREQSGRLSTDRDDSTDEDGGDGSDEDGTDEDGSDEDGDEGMGEEDTFPRSYVKRLRDRSAGYRHRATAAEARADELARALFADRVRALDVLADPTDLEYSADLVDSPDELAAAVDDLVTRKPHLRRRGVMGDQAGNREQHDGSDAVSLLGIMRGGA